MNGTVAQRSLVLFVVLWGVNGCGVVGPPIAPEYVGVTPVIERQKRQQAQQAGQQPQGVERTENQEPQPGDLRGQDEDLPPLRPVGTR